MTIPADWLIERTSEVKVERELAEAGAPDFWLKQWRAMLDRSLPEDELWEYEHFAVDPERSESAEFRVGFALVRRGQVHDWIEAPDTF